MKGFTAGRLWRDLIAVCLTMAFSSAQADVGRTPGSASVSATGTGNYTIPIWAPSGAGGMVPSLAFSYSHLDDVGLLGAGWRITGFSLITRCNKTKAQDGVKAAPMLVADDAYCLDGNKLRLESGTAGTSGAVYRTEMETYSRITAQGTAGGGPAWFQVKTKDGFTYEYGATNDSRILTYGSPTARVWALSSVRDPSGNHMEYVYVNDTVNGSYRPDEIRYATNTNAALSTAPYSVKFLYENRPDPLYGYANGSASVDGRINEFNRLDRVEIRHQGIAVRIYDLAYSAGAGARSRLQSITECATSLSACLSPTTFTYYTETGSVYRPELAALGEVTTGWMMDVNADGRDDFVYIRENSWRRRLAVRSTSGEWTLSFQEGNSGIQPYAGMFTWMPIEWDGDGLKDILVGVEGGTWKVLRSVRNSDIPEAGDTGVSSVAGDTYGIADLNGDGREDLLRVGSVTGNLHVYYRQGTTFAAPVVAPIPGASLGARLPDERRNQRLRQRWLDFNGDGREDAFVRTRDLDGDAPLDGGRAILSSPAGFIFGPAIPSETTTLPMEIALNTPLWFGDFNGDGLTDALTCAGVHYSRGNAFATAPVPQSLSSAGYNGCSTDAQDSGVIDYDGDGRDDLILRHNGSGRLHVFNGTGSGLVGPVDTNISLSSFSVIDINGDGFSDLLGLNSSGFFVFRVHSETPVNLLNTAADGFGVSTRLLYAPLTDSAVYTGETGAIYPIVDIQPASFVVKKLTTTDGTAAGSTYDLDYRYAGGQFDHDGRGFLGFASRTIIDMRGGHNIQTVETYDRTFPYIGAVKAIQVLQSNGTPISSTTHTWNALSWGTEQSNSRKFPYITSSTTHEYEVGGVYNGTQIRTTTTAVAPGGIDVTSGLIKSSTRTTTENATGINTGSSYTEHVEHTDIFNDTANWCLGKPAQTQQVRSHTLPGGAQIMRTSSASWDGAQCRMGQTTVEPGNTRWQVTTDYGYDSFGNIRTVTITPAAGQGQTARTTTLDWTSSGSSGRFPVNVINAKSQTTTLGWNYALGVRTSIRDPNGRITSWQHDSFGRVTREQRPDGTTTGFGLEWCTAPTCQEVDLSIRTKLTWIARDTGNGEITRGHSFFDQFDREIRAQSQVLTGGFSTVRQVFDSRGLVAQTSTPYFSGGPVWYTTATYDLLGRPTLIRRQTSETDGSNRDTEIDYEGLSVVTTDALGRSTTQRLNAIGEIVQMVDAAGSDTDYEYDSFGNLRKVRDFEGNETSQEYNVRGMKITSSDPDMGSWSYDYYPLGELKSQTDAKNQTTIFTYDQLSRPLTRDEPGTVPTTHWHWDPANAIGQVESISALSGPGTAEYEETYEYDSLGRLQVRHIFTGAGPNDYFSYSYGYNPNSGLLETITYPESVGTPFKASYEYQYGHLTRIRDFYSPSTVYWQANATNARHQVIDYVLGSELVTARTYDRITGEINRIDSGFDGGSAQQQLVYGWNKIGNLASRQDQNQSLLTEAFTYDALDRLDTVRLNGNLTLDVNYDALGNITSKSDVGSYTYHPTKRHAVTQAGSNAYTYDANGNVTSRNGHTISWYEYNLPKQINYEGGRNAQFWYGPNRQRYKQQHQSWAGPISPRTTIYAGELYEKAIETAAGDTQTLFRHYIVVDGQRVATHLRYVAANDVQTWTHYFMHDHLGSVVGDFPSDEARTLGYSYDAFGKRRGTSWSGLPTNEEIDYAWSSSSNRGFTGHEHLDNVGGLIHMNGRVYDPVSGRFMSADPFVQAPFNSQSLNRYSYTLNNPLRYVDPSGFEIHDCHWGNFCESLPTKDGNWLDWIDDFARWLGRPVLNPKPPKPPTPTPNPSPNPNPNPPGAPQNPIPEVPSPPPTGPAPSPWTHPGSAASPPTGNARTSAQRSAQEWATPPCESRLTCDMTRTEMRYLNREITKEQLLDYYQDNAEGGLAGLPLPPVFQGSKWGLTSLRTWWATRAPGRLVGPSVGAAFNVSATPAGRRLTKHALKSLEEHGFKSLDRVDEIVENATLQAQQADGAVVFIQQAGRAGRARFSVIVQGSEGIVTGMLNLTNQELRALARNYGWTF